jgi:hypothetical protein
MGFRENPYHIRQSNAQMRHEIFNYVSKDDWTLILIIMFVTLGLVFSVIWY